MWKKQAEEISKKHDFFNDQHDKKDAIIKSNTEMDDIETIPYASSKRENFIDNIGTVPYASPKRENDTDDRETIAYASPRRESEDEIDKIIHKETKLETAAEFKKQTAERKKNY